MLKRRVALLVLAGLICGGVVTSVAAAGGQASKPVLTIGIVAGPSNLNPAMMANDNGSVIVGLLTDATLTRFNQSGTVSPELATSFKYVSGPKNSGLANKVFELTLRHNARFSDGEPVTAQAVKDWLEYFPSGKGSNIAWLGTNIKVTTIGKWTVRIQLQIPNPVIPVVLSSYSMWGFVQCPKGIANPTSLSTDPCGAGPYTLDTANTVLGDHYTFVPNKYYWDPAAIKYSKVVVKVIADPSTMLAAAQTGQVDVAQGDASTANAAASAGLNVVSAPQAMGVFSITDPGGTIVKALGDVRVREALNYAIDRKSITTALLGKWGTPTSEILSTDGFDPKVENYYPYNPAKAKALLAAAGYPNGFTLPVLGLGTTWGSGLVQAVAADWAKIGVNVQTDVPSNIGDYVTKLLSGTYPVFEIPVTARPIWLFNSSLLLPGQNQHGYVDQTLNHIFLKAQRLSPKQQPAYWKMYTDRVTATARMIPVFGFDSLDYASKSVGGVTLGQNGFVPDPTTWYPK